MYSTVSDAARRSYNAYGAPQRPPVTRGPAPAYSRPNQVMESGYRPASKPSASSSYALSGMSSAQLHKAPEKKTSPICIFFWFIGLVLTTFFWVCILCFFGSKVFRHAYSESWVLNGYAADELPPDYSLDIEYRNFWGRIRIKEDGLGGEFPVIQRTERSNRNPTRLAKVPTPDVIKDDVNKVVTIKITGFTLLDFFIDACRHAEFLVLLPMGTAVRNINTVSVNGEMLVDLPTSTVSNFDFFIGFDLSNVIGAVSFLNLNAGRVSGYSVKQHVCVGQFTGMCDYTSVIRDAVVTTGVKIGDINVDSLNGNLFVENTAFSPDFTEVHEGWYPSSSTKAADYTLENAWNMQTGNGLAQIHFGAEILNGATVVPERLPASISASVQTTSYKINTETIVLIEGPSTAFDGYFLDLGAVMEPAADLIDGCISSTHNAGACAAKETATGIEHRISAGAMAGDVIIRHV